MAGASQASLVGSTTKSSRIAQPQRRVLDASACVVAEAPLQPSSSQPPASKVSFKGKSEEKFRLLAAASARNACSSEAPAFASSQMLREALDAADTAHAQLRVSDHDAGFSALAAATGKLPASAAKAVKAPKKIQARNITEVWV